MPFAPARTAIRERNKKYKRPFSLIPAVSKAAPMRRLTPVAAHNGPNFLRFCLVGANRTATRRHWAGVGLYLNERSRTART